MPLNKLLNRNCKKLIFGYVQLSRQAFHLFNEGTA